MIRSKISSTLSNPKPTPSLSISHTALLSHSDRFSPSSSHKWTAPFLKLLVSSFSPNSSDLLFSMSRKRSIHALILLGPFYILFVCCEFPFVFKNGFASVSQEKLFNNNDGFFNSKPFLRESEKNLEEKEAPLHPLDFPYQSVADRKIQEFTKNPLSSLNFTAGIANSSSKGSILKSANDALELGRKLWRELELIGKNSNNRGFSGFADLNKSSSGDGSSELCPHSISVTGEEFSKNRRLMMLPCGLTLGSHITVVGKPRAAHAETDPKISLLKEGQYLMVSQFMMELQGLKTVEGVVDEELCGEKKR